VFGRKYVNIMGVVPQGNYAILFVANRSQTKKKKTKKKTNLSQNSNFAMFRIQFDDLHDSGIYSWQYLHWLGKNKIKLMRTYLRQLKISNKSRDPRASSTARRPTPQPAPPIAQKSTTSTTTQPRMLSASADTTPPPKI
jgi:DUF971 family protein